MSAKRFDLVSVAILIAILIVAFTPGDDSWRAIRWHHYGDMAVASSAAFVLGRKSRRTAGKEDKRG